MIYTKSELKRLNKAQEKIDARKKNLIEQGIPEPSKISLKVRSIIAPVFRKGVGLIYPTKDCVLLGDVDKKDIQELTNNKPVIYSITHRSTFDTPRIVTSFVPHSYILVGDEKAFYCTPNEYLLQMNGIKYLDRKDLIDRKLIIKRGIKRLETSNLAMCPEGVPNVYGREMLKLYPGIIKMALGAETYIIPVGNELNIKRNKKGEIIGDTAYYKYEDYFKGQTLYRPSDDYNVQTLYNHFSDTDFIKLADENIDSYIINDKFVSGKMILDLKEKINQFLNTHPELQKDFINLSDDERVNNYLIKCAILNEYNNLLKIHLDILTKRMTNLSQEINEVIDNRHPKTLEELEKDHREYIDFYLTTLRKNSKKGPTNAYEEIDQFINKTTEESIINSETKKIQTGIQRVLKK